MSKQYFYFILGYVKTTPKLIYWNKDLEQVYWHVIFYWLVVSYILITWRGVNLRTQPVTSLIKCIQDGGAYVIAMIQ